MPAATRRVVWVTSLLPHPTAGGVSAHELELLRGLSARHDVHVITAHLAPAEAEEPLRELPLRVTRVGWQLEPWPESRVRRVALHLRAHPTAFLWLARDRVTQLAHALGQAVRDEQPDLVHLSQGDVAPAGAGLEVPSGLLLYDALTRSLETQRRVETRARRRLTLAVESRRMRRFERRWYREPTGVASVSAVDAGWLEQTLGRPVTVLENPLAPDLFEPPPMPRRPGHVAFVGTFGHHPNLDAARWLVSDIWPLVTARRSDATLTIAGRASDEHELELRQLVAGTDIELDLNVDDIRPTYWAASAVVAPVRFGSGLRNKVIHAMACGAPVVATQVALEGVPVGAASAAFRGDSVEQLADAIVTVLDDPATAVARAAGAIDGLAPLRTTAVVARHEAWWESLLTPSH